MLLAGRGCGNIESFCLLKQEGSWMGGIEEMRRDRVWRLDLAGSILKSNERETPRTGLPSKDLENGSACKKIICRR